MQKDDKFAFTVKMGTKGQIVIPKQARDEFGFKPGDTVLLLGDKSKGIAIVKPSEFNEIFEMISKK